mmetsp:Transcript_3636/g.8266  ORF Transcript_3636/g.8266 Transcript_3636/m.8266 type:complete len:221 (-) Transcript_3636:1290-1952(-)
MEALLYGHIKKCSSVWATWRRSCSLMRAARRRTASLRKLSAFKASSRQTSRPISWGDCICSWAMRSCPRARPSMTSRIAFKSSSNVSGGCMAPLKYSGSSQSIDAIPSVLSAAGGAAAAAGPSHGQGEFCWHRSLNAFMYLFLKAVTQLSLAEKRSSMPKRKAIFIALRLMALGGTAAGSPWLAIHSLIGSSIWGYLSGVMRLLLRSVTSMLFALCVLIE